MSATSPWEQEAYANAIAIVGMAGRFRGADTIEALWDVLRDGRETLHRMTGEELAAQDCPVPIMEHPCHVPVTAQLERADLFDANFFGFTPAEARALDPQLRLMLETSWHAFEDAGHIPGDERAGVTGVFAGAAQSFYWLFHTRPTVRDHLSAAFGQNLVLSGQGFNSTWISHKLNLTGPSLNINTACSTGLVAVASGCQNLLDYSCDLALVVTASVFSPRHWGYWAEPGGILSPDGHCRPFDASANGTVMGEGVCALLLRRLGDAINGRDHIRAVIRGYGINNDGARKAGYTAPSVKGQTEVIRMAHRSAAVSNADISYVEAHGTGTNLGDPVEFAGLRAAFDAPRRQPCRIGSVKGNIGHLNISAGTASLIKTVLMFENEYMPPLVNHHQCNPEIDIENSQFRLCVKGADWPEDMPRLAGVSSFGFGGTNCHLVVEQTPAWARENGISVPHARSAPPNAVKDRNVRPLYPLMFSAPDHDSLCRQLQTFEIWFARHADADMAAVCTALCRHRKHFSHRALLMVSTTDEAASALRDGHIRMATSPQTARLAVVHPDYGLQSADWLLAVSMKLLGEYPEQHDVFSFCLAPLGIKLEQLSSSLPRLEENVLCRESLALALGYALSDMLRRAKLPISAVVGQGTGAIAGMCQANILSREEGLRELARFQTGNRAWRAADAGISFSTLPFHASVEEVGMTDGAPLTFLEYRLERDKNAPLPGPAAVFDLTDAQASPARNWASVLGELFLCGFSPLLPDKEAPRIFLPGYTFSPDSHWLPLNYDDQPPLSPSRPSSEDDTPPAERLLLDIWREALGIGDLAANDDFFRAGGTSLTALRILAAIELQLGIKLTMGTFMEARTVDGLIRKIAEQLDAAEQ